MSGETGDAGDSGGTGNVGRRMAKGAVWMVAVKMADRSIGLISTLILARLLVPADFGLVALATSIIAILGIWSEFGFDMALIRDQEASPAHYDTAWTLTFLRGVIVAAAIWIFADHIAAFFNEPRIVPVLYLLSLMSVMEGLQSIRTVDFRKNLELHKEFNFLMIARVAQFVVTITLAFLWQDWWALVGGILTNRVLRLGLSYWMAPYRPRLTFAEFGDLFNFSKWMVFNSIFTFLSSRLDAFVLGRMNGVSQLGLYNMAYEISNMATTELVWPISRAVFPGFAKIAHIREELVKYYNRSLSLIVLIALPATVGIAMSAPYFVPLALGDKWLETIPLMQVLAIYGCIRVVQASTVSMYYAVDKPYLATALSGTTLVVLAPTMIWLVGLYGALGAAWAVVIGSVPPFMLMIFFNARLLQISVYRSFLNVLRPLLSAAVMYGALTTLHSAMPPSASYGVLTLQVLAFVAAGVVVYTGSLFVFWRVLKIGEGAEDDLYDFLIEKLRRQKPGALA